MVRSGSACLESAKPRLRKSARRRIRNAPNPPSTGKQLLDKAEFIPMTKPAREFIKATTTKLDAVLASLPQQDQHDLLDALAAKIEERLDQLTEAEE